MTESSKGFLDVITYDRKTVWLNGERVTALRADTNYVEGLVFEPLHEIVIVGENLTHKLVISKNHLLINMFHNVSKQLKVTHICDEPEKARKVLMSIVDDYVANQSRWARLKHIVKRWWRDPDTEVRFQRYYEAQSMVSWR